MKRLFKSFSGVALALSLMVFTGCSTSPDVPLEPIGDSFKFEKIALNFEQYHFPKTKKYQSKDDVERKLNQSILKHLKTNDMFDGNSPEKLEIIVYWRRIFAGEDLPFEAMRSDKIASPRLGYDIKIVKNGNVLRSLKETELFHKPDFVTGLRYFAFLTEGDEIENRAIEALGKHVVNKIKDFKKK
ncbi:MAG: hypothetical protein CR967_04225 [Proteobacteria bacterium]|nr:MAG: hypothetical protein CR967_04225 [Pseudomonadota bacterium]